MPKHVTLFVFDHANTSEHEAMYAIDISDEQLEEAAKTSTARWSTTWNLAAWAALYRYDILAHEVTEPSVQ